MNHRIAFAALLIMFAACLAAAHSKDAESPMKITPPTSQVEARSRALLLHELANGALQVMHRDFFDDDNPRAIPSASLDDVFQELEKGFGVSMKWLTVNTDIVNFDHEASTEFEKAAVKSIASGQPFTDDVTGDRYQFAGSIRLGSQCLKCHVKLRTSNEDRLAGLVITMPLAEVAAKPLPN